MNTIEITNMKREDKIRNLEIFLGILLGIIILIGIGILWL